MEEKFIYVITHGSRLHGVNPGMSSQGKQEIKDLQKYLPVSTTIVICGTGVRHMDMAQTLNLDPQRYTSLVGGSESLFDDGQGATIMLSSGDSIKKEKFTGVEDLTPAARPFLLSIGT